MKRNNYVKTVVLSLLSITISYAQNFAPIGAKWYYVNSGKIYVQESQKDTLFEGKMCRKLVMDSIPYLGSPQFSGEKNF